MPQQTAPCCAGSPDTQAWRRRRRPDLTCGSYDSICVRFRANRSRLKADGAQPLWPTCGCCPTTELSADDSLATNESQTSLTPQFLFCRRERLVGRNEGPAIAFKAFIQEDHH